MRCSSIQSFALGLGILAACSGAAALVLFFFDPRFYGFYPVCRFHQVTGLLCPGCGSLRALHSLLHGDLAAALRFNGLLVCSLPLLAWGGGRYIRSKVSGNSMAEPVPSAWLWAALVAVLAFGLLRNLPLGAALGLAF